MNAYTKIAVLSTIFVAPIPSVTGAAEVPGQPPSATTNSAVLPELIAPRSTTWEDGVGSGFLRSAQNFTVEAGVAAGMATFGSEQANDLSLLSLWFFGKWKSSPATPVPAVSNSASLRQTPSWFWPPRGAGVEPGITCLLHTRPPWQRADGSIFRTFHLSSATELMLHVGNTLRVRALRRISIVARVLQKGVKRGKMDQEIEVHMKNQFAELSLGRIVLHLVCACRDHKLLWHWRGILREILTEPY